ncbi:hypothetical protein pb186bvf_003366 [Paramecium bursaria]
MLLLILQLVNCLDWKDGLGIDERLIINSNVDIEYNTEHVKHSESSDSSNNIKHVITDPSSIKEEFNLLDQDGDNLVTIDELRSTYRTYSENEIGDFFITDGDMSGTLTLKEFISYRTRTDL